MTWRVKRTKLLCLMAWSGMIFAQPVDIRPSSPNTIPEMRSRFTAGRYELRNATLVDLIHTAYGVDPENVLGGPAWLDVDRFDVIATVPAGATTDMLKSMLQGVLKDRFQLSAHR